VARETLEQLISRYQAVLGRYLGFSSQDLSPLFKKRPEKHFDPTENRLIAGDEFSRVSLSPNILLGIPNILRHLL